MDIVQDKNDMLQPYSLPTTKNVLRRLDRLANHRFGGDVTDALAPSRNKKGGDGGPYLVICNHKPNSVLLPMFENFTVVNLFLNETAPPWNATAFLSYVPACGSYPYVAEALRRRSEAPYLFSPAVDTDVSLLGGSATKSVNGGKAALVGERLNGVFWPDFSGNKTYLKAIHNRPAIVKILGEVFWRGLYNPLNVDFAVYREIENPVPSALTVHYLQGVDTTYRRGIKGEFGMDNSTAIYENRVEHPFKPPLGWDLQNPKGLCNIMMGKDVNEPLQSLSTGRYDLDVMVRHSFFRILSEYKNCTQLRDGKSPQVAFRALVGYKFHITMENTQLDGYVSEKLFNGALGGGIPVYFGARDVGQYVNEKAIVHCNIDRKVIEEMRSLYPAPPRKPGRKLLFKEMEKEGEPTGAELMSWSVNFLRPHLKHCVDRVIALDQNDTAYGEVLRQPFVVNHDVMSGRYPLRGIALAYSVLRGDVGAGDLIKEVIGPSSLQR